MRTIIAFLLMFSITSCTNFMERVEGNGVLEVKERQVGRFEKLEVSGSFDVELVPSDQHKVVIEADENLQQYIVVEQSGSRLKIKMRNNINLRTANDIRLKVYMRTLEKLEIAGSGNVSTAGPFENNQKMDITIAGSGSADLELKTPDTKVSIGGSGKVTLTGKTRNLEVSIGGSGDFVGPDYLAEKADVSIAGSGNAKVFASIELDVSIAGSGDVFYKGNPQVKKSVAGSGSISAIP